MDFQSPGSAEPVGARINRSTSYSPSTKAHYDLDWNQGSYTVVSPELLPLNSPTMLIQGNIESSYCSLLRSSCTKINGVP